MTDFRQLRIPRKLPLQPLSEQLLCNKPLIGYVVAYKVLFNSCSYANLVTEFTNIIDLLKKSIPVEVLFNINRRRDSVVPEDHFVELINWLKEFPEVDQLCDELLISMNSGLIRFNFVNLVAHQKKLEFKNLSILRDSSGLEIQLSNSSEGDQKCSFKETINDVDVDVMWPWGDPKNSVKEMKKIFLQLSNGSDLEFSKLNLDFNNNFVEELRNASKSGIKLREHQVSAIENWFANDHRGIYAMCTGAGKTIAALETVRQLKERFADTDNPLRTVVIVCPKNVLVEQWEDEVLSSLFDFPQPRLVYSNKKNYINELKFWLDGTRHQSFEIIITNPESFLKKKAVKVAVDEAVSNGARALLIVDEMHNMASTRRRNKLNEFASYFDLRLGLSATPEIEGNESATVALKEYFGDVCGRYELADGIRDGYLCKYLYYPEPIFLSKEHNNEYLKLLHEIDQSPPKGRITLEEKKVTYLKQINQYIPGLAKIITDLRARGDTIEKTLVFCPPGRANKEEATKLIEEAVRVFQNLDIQCQCIVSEISKSERHKVLNAFRDNRTKVLLSITCLDEGMNVPATNRAIILYSFNRKKQFIQRRGRVLRKSPGKEVAIIHDIIILPHNSDLTDSRIEDILSKETRRYSEFAKLAENKDEALEIINTAIAEARGWS